MIFQALVLVSLALQIIGYIFSPIESQTDPLLVKFLRLDGYGALLQTNSVFLYYSPLIVGVLMSIGLLFFQNWGRILFLGLLIYGCISALLLGIRVATPLQVFVSQLLTLMDGAIFALVFWSDLSERFKS